MAQIGTKRAIPSKNEPKCKFCRHEHREQIDQLLLARSMHQKDPATGARINLQYVLDALTGLGVENPTEENCKTHWRRHVEVVDAAAADEMNAAVEEMYGELIAAAPTHLSASNVAEWQIKLWMAKELARLRSGEGPSVTTDQSQTAQKILQAEKSNEETRQLLGGVAGALSQVFGPALPKREQNALPPVVEDAEFEVVDG